MRDAASRATAGGTCPVKHDDSDDMTASSNNSNWWKLFSSSPSLSSSRQQHPLTNGTTSSNIDETVVSTKMRQTSQEATCPVLSKDSTAVPASLEEAARYAQTPQPDQTIPLALDRQVSSIPRGSTSSTISDDSVKVPDHQLIHHDENENENKWVYPSEQQMYNAMRKKGWTNVPEESIPVVLKIHNHINESTWNQILDWENVNASSSSSSSSSSQLSLVRFQGRPNDMSPKAFIFTKLFRLYDPPFDRHDWYVQKHGTNSRIQRYVIDYYYLPTTHPNMPPVPYVDARPALDHPYAIYLHARRFVQLAFPGIMAYFRKNER
jgi:cytochrome c heme-lyase